MQKKYFYKADAITDLWFERQKEIVTMYDNFLFNEITKDTLYLMQILSALL